VKDIILRFLIGGVAVSAFAALGDVLKPKSFAGLFGVAPSIALATLGLTIAANGKMYAATEARSMIAGALVFFLYAWLCSWLMLRGKLKPCQLRYRRWSFGWCAPYRSGSWF
jgi:hypothetical protein